MAEQRPIAMDPPHITEFASERYFEKLNQLNAQQQHEQQAQSSQVESSVDVLNATATGPSRFILPLRETKTSEDATKTSDQKRDKSRFFSIRSKLHSTKSTTAEPEILSTPTRVSTESRRKSVALDQSILCLPPELQVQIISSLPLPDVLNLRLASKSWHALITLNEAPIVRHHLDSHIPAYALRLYPITDNSDLNFHYLCSQWHRLHVAAKLAYFLCEWITKDIFLRQTEAQRAAFAPQHERMRRRLIPLLFVMFHFFEMHRKLHLERVAKNGGHGLQQEPYTLNPVEAEIMNMYDDRTLLRVHEIFPLVVYSFCKRLRPPTYVGRVERSIRGYIKDKPSEEVHAAILCIGGLRQVEKLWEIKGYNARRGAVDAWYNKLTKETAPETHPKTRRGLMGFGRKKSTGGEIDRRRSSFNESLAALHLVRSAAVEDNSGFDPHWIFNTSLSAGFPMASLPNDQAQTVLGDLPILQQIWTRTAEAMILDRHVVESPNDIKRNQQVMLDLIREEGVDEEDEWWYGRSNADSVRPRMNGDDDEAD